MGPGNNQIVNGGGARIVLTADRTLMAAYRLLFDGMLAASQTTTTPSWLLGGLLMPRDAHGPDGQARVAPMGLRRIEAALLESGLSRADVSVVDDAHLARAIGPATRAIGISCGEPIGLGMNSSTMAAIAGGRSYPEAMFRKLMRAVNRCRRRAPEARVVVGGPGAWQLAGDAEARRALQVDHVVTGYAEAGAAEIFAAIVRGEALPEVIEGKGAPTASDIPPIRAASTMGIVEISRGCGLNCSYCTIARVPMLHLPPATVVADARTNVAAGLKTIAILSEDLFRYGGEGWRANPEALLSLLRELRRIEGLGLIQVDHANLGSIAQFSDEQLRAVRDLLAGDSGANYLWVNVGVETASGSLLRAIGAGGKMFRCAPEEWGAMAARELRRLCAAGFLPFASLMIGLPQETEEDLRATLQWVRDLSDQRITVFPVLYAPIDGEAPAPRPRDLKPLHWELLQACYRLNFRWVPRMYWDNQRAAGVSVFRRLLLQAMGQGQVLQWKALLAWHKWRSRR